MNVNDLVPGSTPFKEAVKRSTAKISFSVVRTVRGSTRADTRRVRTVTALTIGVVVVSTDTFCYIIAPVTKFHDTQNEVDVYLPNGNKMRIQHQNVQRKESVAMFYLRGTTLGFAEMRISDRQLAATDTIYLFSRQAKEEILTPGNLTFVGEFHIKHDCSSPDPATKDPASGLTVQDSGEILIDSDLTLVGIVKETNRIDRTDAMNAADIRRSIMENNEDIDAFRQRIIANAHHP